MGRFQENNILSDDKDYQNLVSILEDMDWTVYHFPTLKWSTDIVQVWIQVDQISKSNFIIKSIMKFDEGEFGSILYPERQKLIKLKKLEIIKRINESSIAKRITSLSGYKLISFSKSDAPINHISLKYDKRS